MGDGYVVAPQTLRTVAGTLRAERDALGTGASHGLTAGVDAGQSTGELAKALGWLTDELEKARTSLGALADKVERAAENYDANEQTSAATYGDARLPLEGLGAGAGVGPGAGGATARQETP